MSPEQACRPDAAARRMQPGLDQRTAGLDPAGQVLLTDLALGAQRDHRRLRVVAVAGLDRRLQLAQLFDVHGRAPRFRQPPAVAAAGPCGNSANSRSRRRARAMPSRGRGRGRGTERSSRIAPGLTAQHDDPVGQEQRLVEIVGDEKHGRAVALPQADQLLLQRLAGQGVERAERLVQQEHGRTGHQRAGEGGALRHAAGQRLGQRLGEAARGPTRAISAAARRSRSVRGRWRGRPNATLSMTSSHGIRRGSWNTMPTLGEGPVERCAVQEMRPWLGASSPATRRRSVLLPQPLAPTTARISPSATLQGDLAQGLVAVGEALADPLELEHDASLLRREAVLPPHQPAGQEDDQRIGEPCPGSRTGRAHPGSARRCRPSARRAGDSRDPPRHP